MRRRFLWFLWFLCENEREPWTALFLGHTEITETHRKKGYVYYIDYSRFICPQAMCYTYVARQLRSVLLSREYQIDDVNMSSRVPVVDKASRVVDVSTILTLPHHFVLDANARHVGNHVNTFFHILDKRPDERLTTIGQIPQGFLIQSTDSPIAPCHYRLSHLSKTFCTSSAEAIPLSSDSFSIRVQSDSVASTSYTNGSPTRKLRACNSSCRSRS